MILEEKELFNLIKENIIPDLKPSEGAMSPYDCYSLQYNLDLELKCRRSHYSELLIEKMKYDSLILRAEKYGTTPVYVNSTPKGIWVFRILDIEQPKWQLKKMPKTTDFKNNEKVDKEVGFYSVSLGTEISTHLNVLLTL